MTNPASDPHTPPSSLAAERPAVLFVGGVDPAGDAGLARDLAVAIRFDVHACPVTTCLTVQDQNGLARLEAVPVDLLEASLEAAWASRRPQWMKVGAVAGDDQARAIAGFARRHAVHVVHDPVLQATRGGRFATPTNLAPLLDTATLVTPNQDEATALGLTDGDRVHVTRGGDLPGVHRGTGCRFAARLTCLLAHGLDREAAVAAAHRDLEQELTFDAADQQETEPERTAHLQAARRSLWTILHELRFDHIQEVGMNFAYALAGADDPRRDVAGLAGRITIAGFDRAWTGRVAYGGPHHTGRIAVVLQEYAGPGDRPENGAVIVMNHRYDPAFIAAAQDGGLTTASFSRHDEPDDAPSSMEWGVRHAIAQNGGTVPDLVWDAGGDNKEAMIRIVAADPDDLVRKLRIMHDVRPLDDPDGRAPGHRGDRAASVSMGRAGGSKRRLASTC